MELIRLLSEKDESYGRAMNLYRTSFPLHEQREEQSQIEILRDESYHFSLIFDSDIFVGILLYWETDYFIYVEHFCIDPDLRNRQYGQRDLKLLNHQADRKGKTVILEIDPLESEISVRRKAFYERARYKANPYCHVHPPYHSGNPGHSLVVMSYPEALNQTNFDRFKVYLEKVVMNLKPPCRQQ